MRVKAVFFDFGGTLADREGGYWKVLAHDMERLLGIPYGEARRVFREELSTTPMAEELGALKRKCRENSLPESNAQEFLGLQLESIKRFEWEPNAIEVVKALKGKGLITGIITNTDGMGTRVYNYMEPDIRPLMDTIVFSSEERASKPDKRLFEIALERTGVGAEEAVYVGDKEDRDVDAPHAVGMKAVLYDPRGESNGSKADYVIRDLKEILKLV